MRITGYDSLRCSLVVNPGSLKINLKGDFELKLGERWCAGKFVNGKYVRCKEKKYPYCDDCKPFDPCAVCKGKCLKEKMECAFPHSIYLALFSPDVLKVGVTKSERLVDRLKEQGADLGVEIARCENGMVARLIESKIAELVGDRVSTRVKIKSLTQKPNMNVWEGALLTFGRIGDVMKFDYFDKPLEREPLPLSPTEYSVIAGFGIGCKGNIFVFERFGILYALDLKELIGFDLVESNEILDGHAQSSIDFF